ncbi:MAG: hypothetical protein R3F30_06580 [Planctomycetota bacterium]
MKHTSAVAFALLLTASLTAQTQTVRGKVEDVQGQNGKFVLDCTNIPLTSATLNLNAMVGQQFVLQVVNKGTAAIPSLEVSSAAAATKIFDIGNLDLGKAARWQVNHTPGSAAVVFVNGLERTSYIPLGAWGTWLLNLDAAFFNAGVVNNQGQFEFTFTMPNIPALVGKTFVGQAVVVDPQRQVLLSNPDCKEVRSK